MDYLPTWKVKNGHIYMEMACMVNIPYIPSKIEWDLTNGPLSKLLELLDTQV